MMQSLRRRGSALAGLMIFLAIVAGIVMAISYQSQNVRRASVRSNFGFEAIEIAESAINEAAAQVSFSDIFDPAVFNAANDGYKHFFIDCISTEQGNELNELKTLPGGYKCFFRDVKDSANVKKGELFTSLRWPLQTLPTGAPKFTGFLKKYQVPKTREYAANVFGFVKVDDVNMSVMCWRRDWVPPTWQDWGVLHYRAIVYFDDGKTKVQRALHIERLWSIYAHTMTSGLYPDKPVADPREVGHEGDINYLALHLIKSKRNLKTVILAE